MVKVGNDVQNLQNLLDGRVEGFIADRIVAATVAWRQQKSGLVEEHPLRFSTEIHFMLSRASQTTAMLARIDDAIDEIKRSGQFQRIADAYALPILPQQTLDSNWFQVLALLGTAAFALSGVVLAYAGQYTLLGLWFSAAFLQQAAAWSATSSFSASHWGSFGIRSPCSQPSARCSLVWRSSRSCRSPAPAFCPIAAITPASRDAADRDLRRLCLAAFVVVGVVVVLDTSAEPLWLWGPISAAITSSFGGLMRDLVRNDHEIATLRGELYPEIAVIWGLGLSLFLRREAERLQADEILLAVVVTIAGAFLTRLMAVVFGLKGWSYA